MPVSLCAGKVQGQLFFAQLKPISIRLCAQCVAKRRREIGGGGGGVRGPATLRFVCHGKSLYYITCVAFVVCWQT